MKETDLIVVSNERLNKTVYEMVLRGESVLQKCGQFIEIKLNGFTLRRPFSVADSCSDSITLLYKVVGEGTAAMTALKAGDSVNSLISLGSSFDMSMAKKPLLIGGGIGCAPLYYLAKSFVASGIRPTIVMGFRNAEEVYYRQQFEKIADVFVCTDDGSVGDKGNVLSVLKARFIDYDFYYACGPEVMLKAVQGFSKQGELSLEARMGCGFGVCMGCSVMTTEGSKRVCKEGPVFSASEVLW